MTNSSFPPMRDQAAIPHLTRTEQEDGTICYFFGDTTIRAIEAQDKGKIHLAPLSGDQAACGEWVDLEEDQILRYCDLLVQHLNCGTAAQDKAAETAEILQEGC